MSTTTLSRSTIRSASQRLVAGDQIARTDRDYPLSQFLLKPLAAQFADMLVATAVRPVHVTILGATFAMTAAVFVGMSLGPMSVDRAPLVPATGEPASHVRMDLHSANTRLLGKPRENRVVVALH